MNTFRWICEECRWPFARQSEIKRPQTFKEGSRVKFTLTTGLKPCISSLEEFHQDLQKEKWWLQEGRKEEKMKKKNLSPIYLVLKFRRCRLTGDGSCQINEVKSRIFVFKLQLRRARTGSKRLYNTNHCSSIYSYMCQYSRYSLITTHSCVFASDRGNDLSEV